MHVFIVKQHVGRKATHLIGLEMPYSLGEKTGCDQVQEACRRSEELLHRCKVGAPDVETVSTMSLFPQLMVTGNSGLLVNGIAKDCTG